MLFIDNVWVTSPNATLRPLVNGTAFLVLLKGLNEGKRTILIKTVLLKT